MMMMTLVEKIQECTQSQSTGGAKNEIQVTSWRKFKLILAKDRKLREKLRDLLDEINEMERKK